MVQKLGWDLSRVDSRFDTSFVMFRYPSWSDFRNFLLSFCSASVKFDTSWAKLDTSWAKHYEKSDKLGNETLQKKFQKCHSFTQRVVPIHLVCFISNAYKQRFWQGLEFFENISNSTPWSPSLLSNDPLEILPLLICNLKSYSNIIDYGTFNINFDYIYH